MLKAESGRYDHIFIDDGVYQIKLFSRGKDELIAGWPLFIFLAALLSDFFTEQLYLPLFFTFALALAVNLLFISKLVVNRIRAKFYSMFDPAQLRASPAPPLIPWPTILSVMLTKHDVTMTFPNGKRIEGKIQPSDFAPLKSLISSKVGERMIVNESALKGWRGWHLHDKVGVAFITYSVVCAPLLLFAFIASPYANVVPFDSFIAVLAPIFILPVTYFVLVIRYWLQKRRAREPYDGVSKAQ